MIKETKALRDIVSIDIMACGTPPNVIPETSEQLVFRRLNLASLGDTKEDAGFFSIRKEPLSKIVERILYYNSGCYMISGQRGCGKTSLINQLIYLLSNIEQEDIRDQLKTHLGIEEGIIPQKISIFPVKIDVVKKYDEIELLQKILRATCNKFLEICNAEKPQEEIKRRIGNGLLKILEDLTLDARESLDYRKIASTGAREGKTTSFGLALSLAFSEAFNSLVKSAEIQTKLGTMFSREISIMINRNISAEAREYTVEKLESRLEEILRSFTESSFIKKLQEENIKRLFVGKEVEKTVQEILQKKQKLDSFQKNVGKIGEFCSDLMRSVIDKLSRGEKTTWAGGIFDKIVIIIDDTDKAGYKEALEVLSSLRALFQLKNCFFLFVGSERFYEDWYSHSNPAQRSTLDSIFGHVFYIPPFSVSETVSLLERYLQEDVEDLDYYARVLIAVGYGLPRQILRILDLITAKEKDQQVAKGRFFDFFMQGEYPKLVRNFVDKFTKYNDPRMEKCLYMASAILASQEEISYADLREFLNNIAPTYPENIKERIIEDLAEVAGSHYSEYYRVNTRITSAFLESGKRLSRDKRALLNFLRGSFQDREKIRIGELEEMLFLIFGDDRNKELIKFLEEKKIVSRIRVEKIRLMYNLVFEPQQILEIDREFYKPEEIKPSLPIHDLLGFYQTYTKNLEILKSFLEEFRFRKYPRYDFSDLLEKIYPRYDFSDLLEKIKQERNHPEEK